jgi:hypothetical protein
MDIANDNLKKMKGATQQYWLWFVSVVGAGLVAIGYSAFVLSNFVNFPAGDDYIILFGIGQKAAEQGWGALSYANLTEQVFSHRTILTRMTAALQVLLQGHLDFFALRAIGLGFLVATFFVVCRGLSLENRYRSAWWFVLLALIFFQPQLSGSLSSAIQGPPQIIPLAVAAAFLLRAQAGAGSAPAGWWRWAGSWMLAFLAAGGAINALLAALVLVLWDACERKWTALLASFAACALLFTLYFYGYRTATHSDVGVPFDISAVIPGALVMLGSIFKFGTVPLSAVMAAGLVLLVSSLWCTWKSFRYGSKFAAALILFQLGSVGMAALGRAGWGLSYMLQWRYLSVSLLLLVVTVGCVLPVLMSRLRSAIPTVMAVAAFSALAWWEYSPRVTNENKELSASAMGWWLGVLATPAEQDAVIAFRKERLDGAVRLGIFQVPLGEEARALAKECASPVAADSIQFSPGLAGYAVKFRESVVGGSDFLTFQENGVEGLLVAFRTPQKFAFGRFFRGEAQQNEPVFCLMRSVPGEGLPEGSFFGAPSVPRR